MSRPLPPVLPIHWPDSAQAPPPETERAIDHAVRILDDGGLVAIPTETVYGLAAIAMDRVAVRKIFTAKSRPVANPLIVHVADASMARALVSRWPGSAETIALALWPGPVTVVVPRGPRVPDEVTAGGETVALRCPAHRLTRLLIEKLGRPLAAPSANRSLGVSPTTAEHVLQSLGSRVDLVLDGGPCDCGIESTVVDCTTDPPSILRSGPIGRLRLEQVLGRLARSGNEATKAGHVLRSPGQLERHYAPSTPLEMSGDCHERIAALAHADQRIGWLALAPESASLRQLAEAGQLVIVSMPSAAEAYAARLYATLHALDRRNLDVIVVDEPPATDAWHAVRDRLQRATTPSTERI